MNYLKITFLGLLSFFSCASFTLASTIESGPWDNLSESTHFVYHFNGRKEAETIIIHAEVYYEWIKKLFAIEKDEWDKKAHIYIFEDKEKWKAFSAEAAPQLEGTAFTNGGELYIYRDPFWLSPMKTIAHELTHVTVFRFLNGPIPLFLNEGFAEYVSFKAVATQFGGNEYQVRTIQLIPEEKYIPLEELSAMLTYPEGRVDTFYQESELLVRFLVQEKGGRAFYAFLSNLSDGRAFQDALEEVYGLDLNALEEKFKATCLKK